MNNKYDVIVVGGGNAGLMAAATTAKAGYRTLLLERHNLPGGSASSFRRGRFEFEPSLHELCTVGTKENPKQIYQLLDGVGAKVDWRYEDKVFRAVAKCENGYDVTLRTGIENFIEDMEKYVPGSRESVSALYEIYKSNCEAMDYVNSKDGKPNTVKMLLKHTDFVRSAAVSVEELEDAVHMPQKAKDIFNTYWCYLGVPTDELNAMHYLSMVFDYIIDRPAMPYKRSHEMSLALEKAITDHGGQVWYNSEVTRFIYDDKGRCIGVALEDMELYAKEIISNVIPHNVYNMSEAKNVPQRELKLANARELGLTFVTIYIGLDKSIDELGIKDYTVFIMNNTNPRHQKDHRMESGSYYVVNCLNAVIPDASPEGTSMLFFTLPVFCDDLPEDLSPENYKKWKNEYARQFIADYEKVMGVNVFDHIEEISVATPVTFARYLGTPKGEIYGYTSSGWDNVIQRATSEAKDFTVPGLTYCGGHGVRGDGYSSAFITGDMAGRKVIARLGGKK